MCPAKIAVPCFAPGLAPGLHQPTIRGSGGTSSSPSGRVPTLTIRACSPSRGISIRFGDRLAAFGAGPWPLRVPPVVGITPTFRDLAWALPRPQYGEVVQE